MSMASHWRSSFLDIVFDGALPHVHSTECLGYHGLRMKCESENDHLNDKNGFHIWWSRHSRSGCEEMRCLDAYKWLA